MSWPQSVLSRFVGGPSPVPDVPVVACGAPASGFEQLIDGVGVVSPVPPSQRPGAQQLLPPDYPVSPAWLGVGQWTGYVPGWTEPGIVGFGGLFGLGAVAYRRATHETLTPTTVDGFTVYLDPQGMPA